MIAYADDTAVPMNGHSWRELSVHVSDKLDSIFSWLYQNKLILNMNKSVYVTFGNYKDSVPDELDVFLNGGRLKRVVSCKYLGVIYDYNIKWDLHVNNVVNKTKISSICFLQTPANII